MILVDDNLMSLDKACEVGVQKFSEQRISDASEIFQQVIQVDPCHPRALNALAIIALGDGNYIEAHAYLDKVLMVHPSFEKALNTRGTVLVRQGDVAGAIENFNLALQLNPAFPEPYGNLAELYFRQGRYGESVGQYRQLIALTPHSFKAYYGLGTSLRANKEHLEAIVAFRKARTINPAIASAWAATADTLCELGLLGEAKQEIRAALQIEPHNSVFLGSLGLLFLLQGCVDEAIAWFRRAIDIAPDNMKDHSNLLLAMHYSENCSPAQILRESLSWKAVNAQGDGTQCAVIHDGPIRIGYVSPDFKHHVVAYFIEPLLAAHDRRTFEIHCYSDVAVPDQKTRQLEQLADRWTNIFGMPDQDVAQMVAADQIDILVDLAGHTANNRLGLFQRKPAPIQATWLGYPGTTGLSVIDYRISDQIADPEGTTESFHSEALVRLKDGFLCFLPPERCPDVTLPPAVEQGVITFGSFNNLSKLTPSLLTLWNQLLRRVPHSRLLLKSKYFVDEETCNRLLRFLCSKEVARERIILLPFVPGAMQHLASYNQMDIALDSFPYNGTTTTFDSLLMGVPVITLAGEHHAARVGASILTRIGLDDLVATTREEYLDTAGQLAKDVRRLLELKQTLRGRLFHSVLCDATGFAGGMEDAYRQMLGRKNPERKI